MATQDYTNGVTLTDAGEFERFDCAAYAVLSGIAGTNTITATGPATYTYDATRPPVWFIPANTNTGATTINITPSGGAALGAKNIFLNGAALQGGELRQSVPVAVIYDGTQFHIIANAGTRGITLGTEQATTSGTAITFTGIPFGVRRITMVGTGISTSGVNEFMLQLGDAGGIETSGYTGSYAAGAPLTSTTMDTDGFNMLGANAAAATYDIHVMLTLENASNNTWNVFGFVARTDAGGALATFFSGVKATSAVLDRVSLTTDGSTDTFDAGVVNITYEF